MQAVRAAGATQPISLGDGAWGVETTGADNGYSLRALAPLVDFVGPHVYPMEDDQVRQFLTAAFACELAGGFGRPVVLEEFGVSSDFASDEQAAAYYRQVLHTTLLAGARGWIAWNNTDYDDLRDQDPYRHHVFELHFGLTDSHGPPEAAAPRARALLPPARPSSSRRAGSRCAGTPRSLVPEHFERELPFTSPEYRQDLRASLLQGYVAAREADLPIALARERDGIPGPASLVLAPSTKLLTAGGLDRLRGARDRRRDGLPLVLRRAAPRTSAGRGSPGSTRSSASGTACATASSTRSRTTSSRFDFVEPLGDIEPGTRLTFAAAGSPSARSYLPVDPLRRARRRDRRARPPGAPPERSSATAPTVLCTYPLEYMASQTPGANPESTWRLYSALADRRGRAPAGARRRPARARRPRAHRRGTRSPSSSTAPPTTIEVDPIVEDGVELALPEEGCVLGPFDGGDRRALAGRTTRRTGSHAVAQFPGSRFRVAPDGAAGNLLDTPLEGSDATG